MSIAPPPPPNKALTIAFIVGPKNEQSVVDYVKEHCGDLSAFKILVTSTDSNMLSKVECSPPIDVQHVASLDQKPSGDEEIANRTGHNQISAIFVLNYNAICKLIPPDRLVKLCEKAWNNDTFLCFNPTNIDLVMSALVKKGAGKKNDKKHGINKGMREVLLTRYPTFDLELTQQEEQHRRKVTQWQQQQMMYWLEETKLQYLRPVVSDKFLVTQEESKYFVSDDEIKNFFKIRSAPLDKSLEFLTLPPESDLRSVMNYASFERDFLISHHLFITSVDLLKLLRKRYNYQLPAGKTEEDKPSASVIVVLRDWILMEYGSDFFENTELCEQFEKFMTDDVCKNEPDTAKELTDLLNIALAVSPPYPLDLQGKAPRPILPKKNLKLGTLDLFTMSPIEMARQMTLLDEQMFHKVRAKEFLGGAWTKKDANQRAPNLTKFINHTNRVAAWVVTEILKETTSSRIAELITKFIQIGQELLSLRNYAGVMNILTALHSAPIGRLKSAWGLVPSRDRKDFEDLTESLSLLGHYKNYRETLKTLPPTTPCIPLIPVTCSDLNGLGEVLENKTDEGWINWDKHQKVANHIWSVKRFMRARYFLKPVEAINYYLQSAETWEGEKTLAAIAKLRETYGNTVPANDAMKKSVKASVEELGKVTKDTKMTEKDWQMLAPGADVKRYGVGECINPRNPNQSPGRYLYRIKKGSVRIEQYIHNQTINVLHIKEKDVEVFGEMSLFFANPHAEEIIIADETPTEIIKFSIDFVIDKCKAESVLSEKLHKTVCRQLSERLRLFGQKTKIDEKKEEGGGGGSSKRSGKSSTSSSLQVEGVQAVEKKLTKIEKKSSGRLNTASKKQKKTAEEEFSRLFKTKGTEIVIKTYACTLKRGAAKGYKGTLYLTHNNVCFSADVFGRKLKEKYPIGSIDEIELSDNKKRIILKMANIKSDFESPYVTIKDFENIVDAFGVIQQFWNQKKLSQSESVEDNNEDEKTEEGEELGLAPSREEWNKILEGTRSIHLNKDEHVMSQGNEQPQRLYQITEGSCRIEKTIDPDQPPISVGVIRSQDATLFGEISFLEGPGGRATASVVANESETVVSVIEGYYLNILFEFNPGLSGRFYHYLGTVIAKRLKMRETALLKKDEDESEMDADEDRSELGDGAASSMDDKSKKNLIKRTQDIEKKSKKRRKSSNRIVVEGKAQLSPDEQTTTITTTKEEKKSKEDKRGTKD